jgi:hypothetical protein
MNIRNLYIGATVRDIFAAFFVAILFGIISPKSNNKNVTIPVAIPIAVASFNPSHEEFAIPIAIEVANAAVKVFTKLFPIRIVISNLSLFFLIVLRA